MNRQNAKRPNSNRSDLANLALWRSIFVCFVCVACSHPATPRGPSTTVRADLQRAEDAERARHHDVARAEYERAIADAHDPDSIRVAHREFAETLETWGEIAAAAEHLEAAVAAKPDDAASWHDLGILHHSLGDDVAAGRALERAKQLAPNDPRPRIALAALRWARGDRAGAAAEYKDLLRLELSDRVRAKVHWAIDQLSKPTPAPTPST
jgi:Flp pilus assembly protein TadD